MNNIKVKNLEFNNSTKGAIILNFSTEQPICTYRPISLKVYITPWASGVIRHLIWIPLFSIYFKSMYSTDSTLGVEGLDFEVPYLSLDHMVQLNTPLTNLEAEFAVKSLAP